MWTLPYPWENAPSHLHIHPPALLAAQVLPAHPPPFCFLASVPLWSAPFEDLVRVTIMGNLLSDPHGALWKVCHPSTVTFVQCGDNPHRSLMLCHVL